MAESNNLVLKKISDITDFKFFIPSFQRGYRWDIMQVEDLLNDIKEYIDIENKESFLCLQPVVVYEKKDTSNNQNKNQYEEDKAFTVIDGQQRLTTIAIIKYHLSEHNKQLKQFDYNIEYEKYLKEKGEKTLSEILSRIKMEDFKNKQDFNEYLLEDKLNDKKIINLTNEFASEKCTLDKYHIILSYLVIVYYFNKNHEYIDKFIELFTSTIDDYSIQFIWYNVTNEIQDDKKKDGKEEIKINETKAIEIFTRLNIGKIQLTDAELIKALFLKKDNFKDSEIDKKLHIAYKWDEIEKTLNNDTFWYFICNKKNENEIEIEKRNRIELILELAIGINNGKNHELFKEYENKLKENNKFDELWQEIEECFMTLKEWYNDNEMYHYVGFLTCNKKYIIDIYKDRNKNNNNKPINNIKKMVLDVLGIDKQLDNTTLDITAFIDQFHYSNNNDNKISKILLFSNIYTTIKINKQKNSKNDTNSILIHRFPFHLYTKEKWDIEHVSPQTENPLNSIKERRIWFNESYRYLFDSNFKLLESCYDIYTNDNILNEIKNLLTESNINNILNTDEDYDIFNDDDKWNIFYEFMLKSADKLKKYVYLSDDKKDELGNLVLLPRDINRSYKNALFGVKRKHIIDDEKNNRFIPIDTKHVFLKYYSNNTMDLWADEDVKAFKNIIINNIKEFLGLKSKDEDNTNEHE